MKTQISLNVTDGQIIEWRGGGDQFTVSILDWQEKPMRLSFLGVAAVLAMSPIGADLSHLERSDDDPLLLKALESEEVNDSELTAFRFVSAWDEKSILTVIAVSLTLE